MYEIFEKLCREKGLTPYKVSKLTGIGRSTLSDWKSGKTTPKMDKLQKIAELFDVSVDVFTEKEPKKIDVSMTSFIMADSELMKLIKAYGEATPRTKDIIKQLLEIDVKEGSA